MSDKCYEDGHYIPAREVEAKITYRFDINDCPYCRIEKLTAELGASRNNCEIYHLHRANFELQQVAISWLEAELSRYKCGIQMEGIVHHAYNSSGLSSGLVEAYGLPKELIGQRVKVIVLTQEEGE